ncbi:MAG: hypothetical protein J7513_11570 [Solirubrobacteraceae bacterium]|nr:hypothetical protein [Solirubrobacteraceae bacterium]
MFGKGKRAAAARDETLLRWIHLREQLERVALDPVSTERLTDLVLCWNELASTPPTRKLGLGRPAMGFSIRGGGELQDCAITARLLALIDELVEGGHDPLMLLQVRAHLLAGWQRYDEASAALELAASQVPAEAPDGQQAAGVLRHQAATLRAQAGAEPVPSDRERASLESVVATVAESVKGTVPFTPAEIWLHPVDAPPLIPDARVINRGRELAALGFRQLAWIENSWFNEMFGQRVITSAWVDETGEVSASAAAAGQIDLVDVESWLSDGRFVVTAASRGQHTFDGSTWEDALMVDDVVDLAEMVAIHRARLAVLTASTPGLLARPLTSGGAWAAMQEQLRLRKAEFRLTDGLSEAEARGMPLPHPSVAVPMLRAAAREACRAAYAEQTAGAA